MEEMKIKFDCMNANLSKIDSNLVFNFMEGNLIDKNGDWVLIDEMNMATNDVLRKIVPFMEYKHLYLFRGVLSLIERY